MTVMYIGTCSVADGCNCRIGRQLSAGLQPPDLLVWDTWARNFDSSIGLGSRVGSVSVVYICRHGNNRVCLVVCLACMALYTA